VESRAIEGRGQVENGTATPGWLRSFIDRRLEREKVRFVCVAMLAMNLVLGAVTFLTFDGTSTRLGPAPGIDFAGFYTAGEILNAYPAHRLYDFELQDELFHRLLPDLPANEKLPYVYPPFFSLVFRPLALMPYTRACLTWMAISVGLYVGGLSLIMPTLRAIPTGDRTTALLLALSFQPFMECWLSGQASAFGFAAMAMALRFEASGRPLAVGVALSLCLYKPPLLLLVLPMLAIAHRWRTLGGLAAGGLVLAAVSVLGVGWSGCLSYLDHIASFSRIIHSGTVLFPNWKFIDLGHFLVQLPGMSAPFRAVVWVGMAIAALPRLARLWWTLDQSGQDRRMLILGATLTWTLVLNAYIGVYDAVLAVPGLFFVADTLYRLAGGTAKALTPGFQALLVLLYVVPWLSQHLARATGFQPWTIVLMALGAYQLALAAAVWPSAGGMRPGHGACPEIG
jgi:hypothetical protein